MSTGGSTAGNVRDSKVKELYLFYFMLICKEFYGICCVITGKISELDWLADNKDNPINPIKRGKDTRNLLNRNYKHNRRPPAGQ